MNQPPYLGCLVTEAWLPYPWRPAPPPPDAKLLRRVIAGLERLSLDLLNRRADPDTRPVTIWRTADPVNHRLLTSLYES